MLDAKQGAWEQTRVGAVLSNLAGGGTPAREIAAYWNGEIPWASVKDITSGADQPQESVTAEGVANSASRVVPAGTNILAMRMAVGAVARYRCDVAINQDLAALVPSKRLDGDFLFQWLTANAEKLKAVATGTTVKGLRKDVLLQWPLLLPPLAEQRRIADVLRSVDEYLSLTSRTLAAVQAAKNATLIDALGNSHWPETTVGELLAGIRHPMRSGPFGSALLKSELVTEGVPLLGIDNVQVEQFIPTYKRFISQEKYQQLVRYTVFPGDVMVTIMGTVGRCCVAPSDIGTAISSKHVWTLTLNTERYSPDLLAWQINHAPWALEQLVGSAQGGIMSAISSGTLRELVVPLPPPARLREIEQHLLACNTVVSSLGAELERSKAVKAALTDDLLSGRVRVPA